MDKKTLIKYGIVLAVAVVTVLIGRWYFGAEQFFAVCAVIIVFFLLGAYLGATKSRSVTRRIDRDNTGG